MTIQEFQEIVSVIKDILTGITAVVASVVAILGLQTWKRQIKGKSEYELARDLLVTVYKVRDRITDVRNPAQFSGEVSKALKESGIEGNWGDEDFQAKSEAAVYQSRWSQLQNALRELDVEIFEAEAIWGNEITHLIEPIQKKVTELFVNIQKHLNLLQSTTIKIAPEIIEEIDKVIYRSTDEDNYNNSLIEDIERVENYLRPHIKMK